MTNKTLDEFIANQSVEKVVVTSPPFTGIQDELYKWAVGNGYSAETRRYAGDNPERKDWFETHIQHPKRYLTQEEAEVIRHGASEVVKRKTIRNGNYRIGMIGGEAKLPLNLG